jgi:hypothetical protein
MGQIRRPPKAKLFVAQLIAPEVRARADLVDRALAEAFGPIDLAGPDWPFEFTDYYTPEMGAGLIRRIVGFERLIDPAFLVRAKLITNGLEAELTRVLRGEAPGRVVNLDAGYLTFGQVLLATTKSYSHRIYLDNGIWAEVTLRYVKGRYEKWEWTYPDYADGRYNEFWLAMREKLKDSP